MLSRALLARRPMNWCSSAPILLANLACTSIRHRASPTRLSQHEHTTGVVVPLSIGQSGHHHTNLCMEQSGYPSLMHSFLLERTGPACRLVLLFLSHEPERKGTREKS